jgi:hypothetical protein
MEEDLMVPVAKQAPTPILPHSLVPGWTFVSLLPLLLLSEKKTHSLTPTLPPVLNLQLLLSLAHR